jgi:hypothetical protein
MLMIMVLQIELCPQPLRDCLFPSRPYLASPVDVAYKTVNKVRLDHDKPHIVDEGEMKKGFR